MESDGNKFTTLIVNEFIKKVNEFINIIMVYGYFNSGIINVLVMNNKFIYLWQNAKGEINYSFNLSVKEFHTTSITRLGNVLSRHFECNVEVVNNTKEHLKKMISATGGLNKALADSDRYNSFAGYNRATEIQSLPYSNNGGFTANDDILVMLDSNSTHFPPLADHQVNLNINQQNPWHNQEKNHQGIIQLSTYYLEAHINTTYIKIDELSIVHEERYSPSVQHTFYTDPNGVNCKNTYIPTKWMIFESPLNEPSQSFIMKFIFFMAKKDTAQAFKILAWIAYVFWHNKLPYALVLYSKNDVYMDLFYHEILEGLFHDFQCEKIKNDNLDEKSLSLNLDEKSIYNFHNVVTPTIIGKPAYELTNRLIYKDSHKLNKKSVTTVGNVLITSTSKYIPMISDDVHTATVEIDSSIDELCKHLNIRHNKNDIATYIKNDFDNFTSILKVLEIQAIDRIYPIIDCNKDNNLLIGDADPTEIFDRLIRYKDIVPFESMVRMKKDQKLIDEMDDNFKRNRVDKAHLLDYFELLFGKGSYRSNKALIDVLRKDYSKTNEPFDNQKTHVRDARAYYFL